MNGMFAKLSMTELRARQGVCSGEFPLKDAGDTPPGATLSARCLENGLVGERRLVKHLRRELRHVPLL